MCLCVFGPGFIYAHSADAIVAHSLKWSKQALLDEGQARYWRHHNHELLPLLPVVLHVRIGSKSESERESSQDQLASQLAGPSGSSRFKADRARYPISSGATSARTKDGRMDEPELGGTS